MSYDAHKIMTDAYTFANTMIDIKEPLSEQRILDLKSDTVLATKYGKLLMENVVLGAISAYHKQLRENLLVQGLDIGEFDYDE